MLSHLLTIILELGMGFSIPIPSVILYFQDRFNKIFRIFVFISFSLGLSLVFDSLNRLFLHLQIPIQNFLFRISDILLMISGIGLVYLASVFPRRLIFPDLKIKTSVKTIVRNPIGFWSLVWICTILALLSQGPFYMKNGSFNPITGLYEANFGPVYFSIKIFFLACLAISIKFQYQFYNLKSYDPRKLHSKYYIISSVFLLLVFLIIEILKKITWIENELMALFSTSCFIYILFLYNIFSNINISYRYGIRKILLYILVYSFLSLPVIFLTYQLVTLAEKFPTWLIVSLTSLLFLGFQYLGNGLIPLIKNFFYYNNQKKNDAISNYNSSIQELDPEDSSTIHKKLQEFIDDNFKSSFVGFYYKDTEIAKKDSNELSTRFVLDRISARSTSEKSAPPVVLPREIVSLVIALLKKEQNGGLIVDMLYNAERLGQSKWVDELVKLSSCGAEIILPLFQLKDLNNQNNNTSATNQSPGGILIIGELVSDRAFDKEDLLILQLLVTPTILALKNSSLLNSTVLLKEKLEEENKKISLQLTDDLYLKDNQGQNTGFIYSNNGLMQELVLKSEKFAKNDSPLLITGETGTGKSQLANLIHKQSGRTGKQITLNCSAIPADLIENELFGHEKGAYTGATEARAGLVENAQDGTLFMDEIGELAPEGQTKLLRLLQNGEYERIGSNETRISNARFIFATNRNLEDEIQAGNFRLDLYHRISTFELELPALRKRSSDLELLIDSILKDSSEKLNKTSVKISRPAMDLLKSYSYPGNIRELENIIFRALVMNDTGIITPDDLPVLFTNRPGFDDKKSKVTRLSREIEDLEKEILIEAMQIKSGNQREAARLLEISRGSLQYKLKQFKIKT